MPKKSINGVQLNYRQTGDGPDLVLLHGLAANHAFWNPQILAPLARRYRVTTFDLRGHGYSSMPASGYTSLEMVADLIGLMDHLGIERARLMGHSFGGSVALHCTVLHPARVKSLVLADTRVRALQPAQRLRDWPDWRKAKAILEDYGLTIDDNEDEVGLKLLEKVADPQWREERQRLAKASMFVPFSGWSAGNRSADRLLKLLTTTTARRELTEVAGLTEDRIAGVAQPVLAAYGEYSRCMTTCRELMRVLPDCRQVIVPGCGHFYPVIRPVFLARCVLEFLAEVDGIGRVEEWVADQATVGEGGPHGEWAGSGEIPVF